MDLSYPDAETYLRAPKRLVPAGQKPLEWRHKENREKRYPVAFFEARVSLEQVMPRGLKFRISVFADHPKSATFQLELDRPNVKTCLPLYRLEWGAITGHGNGMGAHLPKELQGDTFPPGITHEHTCFDNASIDRTRILSGGVHAARRVVPEPETYDDALRRACGILRIMNPEIIPLSGVQWPLFGAP